ncbi:MAG: response regulator transcription factor [Bacteroidia bacterium]|nr:response regulator transcription factor [Bacteroidia bacterium]
MIRIAIADDHLMFQRGLSLILESFDDCKLVFNANNGQELIQKIEVEAVDVVLMDLEMPVMNGIDATAHLRKHHPEVKIILLTMHDNEQYMAYLVELGVNAYLLKNEGEKELHKAIRSVYENDFYFNTYVQKALLKKIRKASTPRSFNQTLLDVLTVREKEVIQLICAELPSREIAERLFISVKTVETHRRNIREKLGVKGTAGVVIFAMENGVYKSMP